MARLNAPKHRGGKMDSLANDYRAGLLTVQNSVCLSLYQPTHRFFPDNQQDQLRFRKLLKQLEESLRQKHPARDADSLLQPLQALGRDTGFWNRTLDGLAVLCAPDFFRAYRLQRTVPELAIVANSFHTKPLMRVVQSADQYQVLSLTRQKIRLFEGNRDMIDELELARGVPRTITEALGEELTEPHSTVASYGMDAGSTGLGMHHGHGGRKDQVDIDIERFFRVIDRAILEHHSRPSGLPLILAALPEYHGLFHQLSHNSFRIAEGIKINPESLSPDELRQRAWEVMEPKYLARLSGLIDDFGVALAKNLGTDQLDKIAEAALGGRVRTLLIEADRQVPGRVSQTTGHIEFKELEHPDVDDLLDDLGEMVLKKGGEVIVVPSEKMPSKTGVAAIYRF
jgi:hypothetical protein